MILASIAIVILSLKLNIYDIDYEDCTILFYENKDLHIIIM